MRVLDRMFGCLLFLGGIGHGLGSYLAYPTIEWFCYGLGPPRLQCFCLRR